MMINACLQRTCTMPTEDIEAQRRKRAEDHVVIFGSHEPNFDRSQEFFYIHNSEVLIMLDENRYCVYVFEGCQTSESQKDPAHEKPVGSRILQELTAASSTSRTVSDAENVRHNYNRQTLHCLLLYGNQMTSQQAASSPRARSQLQLLEHRLRLQRVSSRWRSAHNNDQRFIRGCGMRDTTPNLLHQPRKVRCGRLFDQTNKQNNHVTG